MFFYSFSFALLMVKKYEANVTIYVFREKFNNFLINLWFKAFVSPYSEIAIVLASSKQFEDRVLVHILNNGSFFKPNSP